MANCTKCGQWAGVFQTVHTPECPAGSIALGTVSVENAELVRLLTPVILQAGRKAGVVAALTFAGIGFVVGIVYAVFSNLASSPGR